MRRIFLVAATMVISAALTRYIYLRREEDRFWRQNLKESQGEIKKNPDLAFWHNQAAIAYEALGDFQGFEREIRLASKLDPGSPFPYYEAYFVYQRRGLKRQRDEALRNALEVDPKNPLGRYQLGWTYEERGDWDNALREYQTAQNLLQELKPGPVTQGPSGLERQYVDPRGQPYSVEFEYQAISNAIKRASAKVQRRK